MITTPRQALELVRTHGVLTMTRAASKPSLVEAIAGPVKGSWWGHPKGQLIFKLAESLHDSDEIITLKLVEGKVTFLHKALWPALARVVTDPEWRKAAAARMRTATRKLLQVVEHRGRIRPEAALKSATAELEKSLLVRSVSVHTDRGSHATELTSWRRVFDSTAQAQARRLKLSEAMELLGLATVP